MKGSNASTDGAEFGQMCSWLLRARGFDLLPVSGRALDIGVDFLARPSGSDETWVVQCKYIRPGQGNIGRIFHNVSQQALTARDLLEAQRALVIINTDVSDERKQFYDIVGGEVWDRGVILQVLPATPDGARLLLIAATLLVQTATDPLAALRSDSRAVELYVTLKALPAGRTSWREYEDVCIDILNHAFIPPFRTPELQSRSEDGLDRRDAVYPLALGNPIWDRIQNECKCRMVVAEFKNHTEAPSQKEVESIAQYLFPKAMRSFGIVCARKSPEESALKARRRAWLKDGVLIVFLSDADLRELLVLRAANDNPAQVIDDQIDEFFRRLTP
jgi:hypothetical protein